MTTSASQCPRCGSILEGGSVEGLCAACLGALNFATRTALPGDASTPPSPSLTPEELAPHFPQLEILACLGRGGMGVVYKARQKSLNRLVALKLLAPERADDPQFAGRFEHEAQALAALTHPHIVAVYDFGVVDAVAPHNGDAAENAPVARARMFFLLMEFVDGVNLRQAMKAGRFTPEQALAVVPPVCEALQYAHEHGIVHRDIKPENLLLDKEGRVKIADFGVAKMLGSDADTAVRDEGPQAGTLASAAGTPQYMAPEQKGHRVTDHRADIYSLGVVLYELLTGELPADKLQPPSRKVQIDVRLDEIVLRALEAQPELRYQTAGEFRTQVMTMTGVVNVPVHATSASAESRPSSQPRWHGWDVWVIAICLVTFGALWLERLQRAIHEGGRALVPNEASHVMLNSALATLLILVGAAFLWMLAKNIGKAPASRAASSKRFLGRTVMPIIAAVVLLRAFIVEAFVVPVNSLAPEIPAGSRILVWKLSSSFATGDMIAYVHEDKTYVGRVVRSTDTDITINRNGWSDESIPRSRVIGRVISVYWRATPQAEKGATTTLPATDDSISLAQAVNDFNKRHHEAAVIAKQPDLTVEDVLAAIRHAMQDRPNLSVTNATFAALGRVTEAQVLPKEFELELLTGYEDDQTTRNVWSVRLRIPGTVIPGGTTCISIHEKLLSTHIIGEEERKVIHAWQEKERARGGIGSFERAKWGSKEREEREAAAAVDAKKQTPAR